MKTNDHRARVLLVLERITNEVRDCDKGDLEVRAEELETMLQGLAENDYFGTELQNDPRGDGRNGEWHMWHVEGIDKPLSERPSDEEE